MAFDLTAYEANPNVRPIPERCVQSLKALDPRYRNDAPIRDEQPVGIVVSGDDPTLLHDIFMKEAQLHPDYWIKFSLVAPRNSKNCGHGSPIINPRMSVKQFAAHVHESATQPDVNGGNAMYAVLKSLGAKQGFRPRNIAVEYMAIYANIHGNLTYLNLDRE